MAGRFYEDWSVGERILHEIRRTVTETDNLLITALTHNPQPLHLDAEAAAASEFGRILVNGIFTFGLMIGVSVGETTVTELKESRSRPETGIVVFGHRMLNQRDEVVCQCLRSAMILRKPA